MAERTRPNASSPPIPELSSAMNAEIPLTVTEFVRVAIRDRILRGNYALGAKLDQQALAEEFGVRLSEAQQTLEPVVALPHQAALLRVAHGAPLMLVTRTSSDTQGRIVEYAQDLYRGDCFRFVSHARAPVAGDGTE